MEISNKLKNFLQDNQDLIKANKWEEIYQNVNLDNVSELTEFLFSLNINPLIYIKSYIPEYFAYKLPIQTFTIPNTIKVIESGAFNNCKNLTNIMIPSSVTQIQAFAFAGCTNLTNIIIPQTVTRIDIDAFSNCFNLTNITFEEGSHCSEIRETAFEGCPNLTIICYSKRVKDLIIKSGFDETRVIIK